MIFVTDKCNVIAFGQNHIRVELDIDEAECLDQCKPEKLLDLIDRDLIKEYLGLREEDE